MNPFEMPLPNAFKVAYVFPIAKWREIGNRMFKCSSCDIEYGSNKRGVKRFIHKACKATPKGYFILKIKK